MMKKILSIIFTICLLGISFLSAQEKDTISRTCCDSLVWHGIPYYTSGYYLDGDTVLNLTINHSVNTSTSIDTCDSYRWKGSRYTQDTIVIHSNTAASCPSFDTLHLTIRHSNTGFHTDTACGSYSWEEQNFTSSNHTAQHTYYNVDGCDSIVTLNLTVFPIYPDQWVYEHGCDSYSWGGNNYTVSTHVKDTFQTINGCDSIVTLSLRIDSSNYGIDTKTACDSYTWIDGVTYFTSDSTATHTLTNRAGCDSVVSLHLTINHKSDSSATITQCDSYQWKGQTFTASGNYYDNYTNSVGCPSVDTLHLTIHHNSSKSESVNNCDSYSWHGTRYTSSGNPTYQYYDDNNCLSVDTLHLTIRQSDSVTNTLIACDYYTWIDGVTYFTSNSTATHTLTNRAGCDSVVSLHLTINYKSDSSATITQCDSYQWKGQTFTASGNYYDNYTNSVGCPSVDTLHLTINYNSSKHEIINECADYYDWNDMHFTSSIDTTYCYKTPEGCPSTDTLTLELHKSFVTTRWNDVLVVNKKKYEGIDDNSIEWYHNDTIIPGATGLYYRATEGLNGTYYAKAKENGEAIQSCELYFEGKENTKVSVSPNPTTRYAVVSNGHWPIGEQVLVTDMTGKVILVTTTNEEGRYSLDMGNLAKGVYVIKIGEEIVKVVKQ